MNGRHDLMRAIGEEQRRLRVDLHPQPISKQFTEPEKVEPVAYDNLDDFLTDWRRRAMALYREMLRDLKAREKKGAA